MLWTFRTFRAVPFGPVDLTHTALDELRARVEPTANEAGHSFAEEIRQRLERTFAEDMVAPETRRLMNTISLVASLINGQTGHQWHSHPAAASIMKHAIDALLTRFKGGDGKLNSFRMNCYPKNHGH